MKRPTFLEGVLVAAATSVGGAALFASLAAILSSGLAARLVATLLALAYVVYLLRRSPERIGRVTTLAAWGVASALSWIALPLPLYLGVQLGLIWLIRSLYFYASLFSALADLALTALSMAAAVWALTNTASLLASLWCLFLVQALFVAIPAHMRKRQPPGTSTAAHDIHFAHAYRVAQTALRRLSSDA